MHKTTDVPAPKPGFCFVPSCTDHPEWSRPAPSPRPVYGAAFRGRVAA